MKLYPRLLGATAALIICVNVNPAAAAQAAIFAKVNEVLLVADDTWGGCMAKLSVNPASVLPACAPEWVTFSCSGHHTTELRAYRLLDQAQLALATGKSVRLVVQDSKTHNGYCFAWRLDIQR